MANLRVGTCSWKYPSWKGLVYSAAKGINHLEEYARRFTTVEVDQWFWSLFAGHPPKLPRAEDVEEYGRSVGDDFRFSIKAPNSLTLTHYYRQGRAGPLVPNPHFLAPDLFGEFLARIEPLGDRIGPVMMQFEYLNRAKMDGRQAFLDRLGAFLDAVPAKPRIGVELRNASWLGAGTLDFFRKRGVIPVLIEGYWMPPVAELFARWQERLTAFDTLVVRLHGGDRKGMEEKTKKRWDRIVEPMDGDLPAIADAFRDLLDKGVDVYVNVNNHYEGSAPLTIDRLRGLMG